MISVIITCHNKEPYLEECIQSILDQTCVPTDIIVVHDGCDSIAIHDAAVNIVTTKAFGVAHARDEGFRLSTQPYVLFVDGDDKLSPLFLGECVGLLNKGADVAYPDLLWWFKHTNYDGLNIFHPTEQLATAEKMVGMNAITTTSMMKREVYEKVNGFPHEPVFEDWFFFLEAMAQGFVFQHANTFLWYRQTKDTRNRQDADLKKAAFRKVEMLYEAKEGKVCRK